MLPNKGWEFGVEGETVFKDQHLHVKPNFSNK